MRRNQQGKQVTGHIHHEFDDNADEDEESEEEDDEHWFDYRDSISGVIKQKRSKQKKVTILDGNGQRHSCKGRFPLLHPWWTVSVKIVNGHLRGHPAYSISQQTKSGAYHVMMLLDDCLLGKKKCDYSVDQCNATKTCFEIFCRETKDVERLSLFTLQSLLQKYTEIEGQACHLIRHSQSNVGNWTPEDHGSIMSNSVLKLKSGLGVTTLLAITHPHLVQTLSELLPYSFQEFLSALFSKRLLVSKAAAMAKRLPWEFGFRQIISRKLNIRGVEAHLSAFDLGGFFTSMPELYKDALHIYEVLKVDSRRNGHMYMPFRTMVCHALFRKLNHTITLEQRWHDALKYLQRQAVIAIEQFDQDDNIFLKHNWQAEVDVRHCMAEISNAYSPREDDFEFDISCPEFDNIRKDPDQVKAVYSAAHFPVTVLSGGGGCGKTTVVTALLKHLCNRESDRLRFKKEQQENRPLEDKCASVESGGGPVNLSSDLPGADNSKRDERQMVSCRHPSVSDTEEVYAASTANHTGQNACEKLETNHVLRPSQSTIGGNINGLSSCNGNGEEDLIEAVTLDLIKILKEGKRKDSSEMEAFKDRFLLTAPTGKAARLLGCKAGLPSATIHSIIYSWQQKLSEAEWKYNQVKVLTVDECSLVSVRLFASLLNILTRHSRLTKVILLGDIKQLPSIEPGDFLRDIFKSLSHPGLTLELTNNHRSESALIVENAKKISQRLMPTFDPARHFHCIEIQEHGDEWERDQAVRTLLNTRSDMKCHIQSQFVAFTKRNCAAVNELCCKHYNDHSTMKKGKKGKDVYDFRPGDKISLGRNCKVLNKINILHSYIEDHEYYKENYLVRKATNSFDKTQAKGSFNPSMTVLTAAEATRLFQEDESQLDKTVSEMMERNEILRKERDERIKRANEKSKAWKSLRGKEVEAPPPPASSSSEPQASNLVEPFRCEEKLCNGEIFFIMDERTIETEKKPVKYFTLSDRDPQLPHVVCVSEEMLRKNCRMKHSWARTIHTYQGSESQTVAYVVGVAMPQNWQHVYTAVTRGKKAVYIVGKTSQQQIAVGRREERRYSRLYHRMKDMIFDILDKFDVFTGNVSQHMALGPEGCPGYHETSNLDVDPDDGDLMCTIVDPTMSTISNGIESTLILGTAEEGLADSRNEMGSCLQGHAAMSQVPSTGNTRNVSLNTHVPSTNRISLNSHIPWTNHVPTTSNIPFTSHVPSTSNVPLTSPVPSTSNVSLTSYIPSTSNIPLTSHVPSTSNIPLTSHVPSTSNISLTSPILSTSNIPLTSHVPSTSNVPFTSHVPITSNVSFTSPVPSKSNVSLTSHVPSTSNVPFTSHVPSTSNVPFTSHVLSTSNVPFTSHVPTTSNVPFTSPVPSTSNVSLTSHVPSTSNVPFTIHVPSTSNVPFTSHVPSPSKVSSNSHIPLTNHAPSTNQVPVTSYYDTPTTGAPSPSPFPSTSQVRSTNHAPPTSHDSHTSAISGASACYTHSTSHVRNRPDSPVSSSAPEAALSRHSSFPSPPKRQRLKTDSPVNSPFCHMFSRSLSIDASGQKDEENPLPVRKLDFRGKLRPV